MDLPPFHHHHRYVPFSDNHPLYQPQPHRLPPHPPPPTVPPLPPTPPPLPHHLTLPPPPPLPPPVQSQFSFLPNSTEEISTRFFNFIPPHLLNHLRPPARPPSPPRVSSDEYSNRDQLRLDDISRFSDIWPDLPPLPRAPPVPPLHYHNHHRPASPLGPQIGSYSNDFQPSFRFQDEFIDEGCRDDDNLQLPLWGRKDIRFDSLNDVDDRKYIGGRERYEWNSNLVDRDFISADSQGGSELSLHRSRNAELNMGNYELYEDLRWRNSSLETDRNYGNNNGVSLRLRGKRQELFDSSGFEDASRYNNSRLGGKRAEEFFNRSTGKKQLQKKSALQRIQLGKTNNNRNRSHDYSHLSKSYHDEPNSGVRSFKEKEKDVSTRMEHKMEEREKSPMELDVSFKSNALVAKAIKASPSPVVDSSRNLTPRNRKIRKLKLSDSPGVKLSEHADDTSSSMHHFDNDHREFSKTVISDKNNSHTTCASHRAASRYKCQKSAENVSAVRTDSYTPGLDIRSDSDNDLREFVKKIGVSACDNLPGGSQPCSSDLGGYNADKEFPKGLESVQDVKSVSFDIDGTPRKRKRVAILLQSKKDGVQPGTEEYSYSDTPLEGILREEGLSSSADIEMVPNVALEFLTDDKVKSSSEYVSDVKKDNMDIVSFQLLLPQSSAMISVLQNSGDAYACEAADHAEISVHDGYSDLNSDKIVEHSYQDKPKLFENGPGGKVMDSVKGNALKESKVHNVQMEDYASRNEGCSNSSPELRLWRISEQIDVSESVNANTKDPTPNEVSISETNEINDCSPNPVSSAGNCTVLCLSPKSEDSPKENTSFINSTVDLEMDSQESTENLAILINLKAPCGEDNCEINLPCMKNIASLSKNLSSHVGLTNSVCRLVDSAPEALFNNMMSSEEIPSNLLEAVQNGKSSESEISNGLSGKEKMLVKSPASGVETVRPTSLGSKNDTKLRQALTVPVNSHKVLPVSQCNSKVLQNSNSLPEKPSVSNNSLTNSIQGGFLGRKSLKYPSVGKAPTFNHVSRPRTWHRIGTPSQSVAGSKSHVSSQINSEKEFARVQNSYIRKGNSLVRKPSPVGLVPKGSRASIPTLNQLNPGIDNLKKARGSGGISNVIGPSTSATVRAFIAGPERPKTPPLTGPVKSLNCKPADQGDSTCSQADPFRNHFPGETLDPSNSASGMGMKSSSEDGVKPSEDTNFEDGSRSNLQGQSTIEERNSGKKITYVKRKSNQLIATNNSCDPSCQSSEKPQALSSEGYYKRRKNQLIRTSVEDNVKQRTAVPGRCLSSERQETAKNARNSSSRQNGFSKKKFSLVWTLHSTLSSKKDGSSGHFRGVRPFLFPWKRATYRTDFTHSLGSKANDNLASSISRKLLLSQKSNTIYKRSISGFSLRRSKVLGFYGRSLKWSKSIERNSRKANEDATLAVAAAEKRKSEQNGAALPLFKSRNYVSRERIFRVGSERYRMDPTGKTLQRISEDTTSYSEDQSENNTKKSFVPRRLLIGNDEYVRIGNGNQLVRDPKKRTRALASEKVRWSLHTARLRLARKKKYCQFFTRFGKCKDDKRCSYIHDPSKIVVCTKFLNGCCSNSNCKLTHKVIPERMQDCSYFLQGLCSNESCPYRHVNVNPNSPVCEGFLRGHCADGNECRKKHTYVCPAFGATGNCQLGSKCKLHHPKTKRKGMKSKASTVQKNGRGLRYFGAGHIDRARSSSIAFPKIITGEGDDHIFCQDGKFTDFISLADSEEVMEEEAVEARFEPSCDSSDREEPSSDIQEDLDELIKPIRMMKKDVVLDSSPAIDNSRGATSGSYVSEESGQNN